MNHKVHMTVDDFTYDLIKQMQVLGQFDSMAAAIKDAILIKYSLSLQSKQGFKILQVQNPDTNEMRVMAGVIR